MPNRKERRRLAATQRKAIKSKKAGGPPDRSELPFAERLHLNVQDAIARSVPPGTTEEEFPFDEAIRALGMMAAVFAIQTQVDRGQFVSAMGDYYDGIMRGLGVGSDGVETQKENDSGGFRF